MHKHQLRIAAVAALLFTLIAAAHGQNISTLAGGGPNNLAATASSLGVPWGVVQDTKGNTYISDNLSNRVFKVNKGTLTVFAGNIVPAAPNSNLNGGVAAATASLSSPRGIALDAAGNVYIADSSNSVIRVVNTQASQITIAGVLVKPGDIVTVAGNATACAVPTTACGYGGLATSAQLNNPSGVWLDASGNIYIADTLDHKIRVVNATSSSITLAGVVIAPNDINTIAGNGGAGYTGDGGVANTEELNGPTGVFVDSQGIVTIADTQNSRIRAVNTSASTITFLNISVAASKIETVAGNGTPGYTNDGSPATSAEINLPSGIFEDSSNNVFIADTSNNVIREVTSGGTISTTVGFSPGTQCSTGLAPCGDGGPATSAELWAPTAVFVNGTSGDTLIADQNDDAVRQVSGGNISTTIGILLDTAFSPLADGSAATDASLRSPVGVAADASGNVYIADTLNSALRKVSAGKISTIAGTGNIPCFNSPVGLPCGDGGKATAAYLSFVTDVFVDGAGNIFLADYDPSLISVVREISAATGDINTVAGSFSKGPGYAGDNGPATSAQISGDCSSCTSRLGVFVDGAGVLYIADVGNNVIRAVNTNTSGSVTVAGVKIAAGNIATIAGVQSTPCAVSTDTCGDGGAATKANLNAPGGVAVDTKGNIYISDSNDNRVRIVNSSGTINKFAGTGTACTSSCGDGGAATLADLDLPQHVFADYAGNVFIADSADFEIREVTAKDGKIQGVVDESQTRGYFGDGGLATAAFLASPYGVAPDPFGNVFISDVQEWRVREVSGLAATAPTANLSTGSLAFGNEGTGVTSAAQTVTITNNGFETALAISKVAISGTNSGDFAVASNTCGSSLAAGKNCAIAVTFKPAATGSRAGTLTITDNAAGGSQNISLSGTGVEPTFSIPVPSPSTASVAAGSSATYSISITPVNGFNSAVTLACTKGLPTGAAYAFSPNPITPGQKSTLTITTTAATGSLVAPAVRQQTAPMFAIWLLLPAMLLSTAGISAVQRKKLISYLLLTLAVAGVLFLVGCGGGSSTTPPSSPTGGTPAGTYTVTLDGTAGSFTSPAVTVTLIVQ